MKRLLLFLLLAGEIFFNSVIYAAELPVTLVLTPIKLSELVHVVYSQLDMGIVIDSDLMKDDTEVSLDLKDLKRKDLLTLVDGLLQKNGYQSTKTGNYWHISKRAPSADDDQVFFYRPKYRSVNYITDLVTGLFQKSHFTFQRTAPNPVAKASESDLAAPPASVSPPVQDTGTSAFSLQDKSTDAFIFTGTLADVNKLEKLLTQIDTPAGEILVKAFIYEVTKTDSQATAFNTVISLLNGKLGANLGVQAPLANSINLTAIGIKAVFSAIESDTRFKAVSNPYLRVKDGSDARFLVGSDVPVLGAIVTQQGSTTQSIDYKSSGVILDLMPTIRSDSIDLDVHQQVSNFILTNTGVNNSPTLIKRELKTTISAKDGDLIMLGGFEQSNATADSSGLSFLPSWLNSHSDDKSQSDILLILQVQRL